MGGFRVNGCGATDRFYPIKELGTFTCPHCRKVTAFTLDEVKRKIDVFFVPTATVSVKYAIMCKSCENGKFVGEEEKNALMAGTAKPDIDEEGIAVIMPQRKAVNQSLPPKENKAAPAPAKPRNRLPEKGKKRCPDCETLLDKSCVFCSECGHHFQDSGETPEPDTHKTAQNEAVSGKKHCPECGAVLLENSLFCLECGHALEKEADKSPAPDAQEIRQQKEAENERAQPPRRTPHESMASLKVTVNLPQKKVCPKCHIFYVSTKEKCTLCGSELVSE